MAGMILAGMLIGSAIVLVSPAQTEIGVYAKLAIFIVFVVAAILGLWLVLRILWRGFREERRLERNKTRGSCKSIPSAISNSHSGGTVR